MNRFYDDYQGSEHVCSESAAASMLGPVFQEISKDDPLQFIVLYNLLPLECSNCGVECDEVYEIDELVGSQEWIERVASILEMRGWHTPSVGLSNYSTRLYCEKCHLEMNIRPHRC